MKRLSIKLKGDSDKKHTESLGSLFQGALMEMLLGDYAEVLHQNGMHPYSQYVCTDQNIVTWYIQALDDDAEKKLSAIRNNLPDKIYLEHRNENLLIMDVLEESLTYADLVKEYFFKDGERNIRINFLTPTSFKSDGRYCIFPTVRLIFQNLMMKYDACSAESKVFSEDILEHFEKYAFIQQYRLRSVYYFMEGTKIPAFKGNITIRITGPQQMVNLANMLAEFGTYAGVGIKTAMGMGGMNLFKREKGDA